MNRIRQNTPKLLALLLREPSPWVLHRQSLRPAWLSTLSLACSFHLVPLWSIYPGSSEGKVCGPTWNGPMFFEFLCNRHSHAISLSGVYRLASLLDLLEDCLVREFLFCGHIGGLGVKGYVIGLHACMVIR